MFIFSDVRSERPRVFRHSLFLSGGYLETKPVLHFVESQTLEIHAAEMAEGNRFGLAKSFEENQTQLSRNGSMSGREGSARGSPGRDEYEGKRGRC
jgi:hypothetical protein